MKSIKFWRYDREYQFLKRKIFKELHKVLQSNELFFGKQLEKFENEFLKKNNSRYGLSVKSGTDAIILSLICAGVKPGDEVITTSITAIPTVAAIRSIGAIPKFIDVKKNLLIDENLIKEKITKKTKAIIPVHLYGNSCNIDKIIEISKKKKIKVIEDCAQSFLGKYKNKKTGNFGDFGCFSFYPTKILGAYGDGGFIVCKNKNDLNKLRLLRFYGLEKFNKKNNNFNKYDANISGYNSRLDNIQASILLIKLKFVDKWQTERRKIAKNYFSKLGFIDNFKKNHAYHLFVISVSNRDKVIKLLKEDNIETAIHYAVPLHKMKAYKNYVCNNCDCLQNSEKLSKKIISLPIYPSLKPSEQNRIIYKLISIAKENNIKISTI